MLRSYRTDPIYHRLMLFATLENHELARLTQVKYTSPVASFLREYVSRRQAEGAFKPLRPELIVHMLFSVVGHYALWNVLGVNPFGLLGRRSGHPGARPACRPTKVSAYNFR